MPRIRAASLGIHLSSRDTAARLRADIIRATAAGGPAEIEMADVETVSESFADEAFAVLADARGAEWFRTRMRLINMSADVRDVILSAILERRTRRRPEPTAGR